MLKILRHVVPQRMPVTGHVDPYNQPNRKGMDPELAEVQRGDEGTVILSHYLELDIVD